MLFESRMKDDSHLEIEFQLNCQLSLCLKRHSCIGVISRSLLQSHLSRGLFPVYVSMVGLSYFPKRTETVILR